MIPITGVSAFTRRSACAVALLAFTPPHAVAVVPAPAQAREPAQVRQAPQAAETFGFAPFGTVHVYAPAGTPEQVVLFVSGDGGWNLGVVPMARRLAAEGALVVGIDIRALFAGLAGAGSCAYPAGSLEQLSRAVQLRRHLPEYHAPILVGYSSGATLVYAALAQAPEETFRGAISLGFCSDLELRTPLCPGRGLASRALPKGVGRDLEPFPSLGVPWTVLQGEADQVCAPAGTARFVAQVAGARLVSLPKVGHGFSVSSRWEPQYVAAYRALTSTRARSEPEPGPAASSGELSGLGLVEVPAARAGGGTIAVLLSGDGGWAGLDKAVAARLAAEGVGVVGWNSLKYYWTPRTPDSAARDLARVLEHYLAAWSGRRLLLAGYSFGADVLPFLVTRLPAELRSRVALVALLGLSPDAEFEFHLSDWIGAGRGGYATAPEIARLAPTRVVCLQGEGDADSGCRALRAPAEVVKLPGGHHFGGDYDRIADALLASIDQGPRAGALQR